MKNFSVSPTCSSVVKVQPNHSAVLGLSIKPGGWPRPSTASKLQMLKSQLSLTGRDKAGVERVALFVALVHCKQWHEAPISVKAPLNDVLFLEILRTYPDQTVAKAAEQALRCHLWYVSEENAGLAFFDSRIDVEKKQMVKALDKPSSKKELKRLEGKMMTMSSSLSSFVTSKTRSFFQKLDADEGFLAKGPGIVEEETSIQGRSETGTWPPSGQRCCGAGHRPSPALPGVHEVGRREEVSPPVSPPPSETCWAGKEGEPSKEAF
ncbi:hypothetical protein GWK47_034568 [Chionoecetes opilio]|uniref:Uncharacterized protein n=1 Tax=Chionoecetes opilio TaxID=41210 RepID=A0A8J5D3K0_CHIOP|nr:hypothetical protein GWK47_034568 [Chionoecetes opilio]